MSKRTQKFSVLVPDNELKLVLEDELRRHHGGIHIVHRMKRRVSKYCSSYRIEELDVVLADGQSVKLLFKDLSRGALIPEARNAKPDFLRHPLREIACYRALLARHETGTAKFYGSFIDREHGRYWLFLERVPPEMLWQTGEFDVWKNVARWLARMHGRFARETVVVRPRRALPLLRYNKRYYWRWMRRAQEFMHARDEEGAGWMDWLVSRYRMVVERLLSLPATVIHGEFFPANVMVSKEGGRLRICPVDWETAAVGPGMMDLAALSSGNWSAAERLAIARAYLHALPQKPDVWDDEARFLDDLDYCLLHQAVQLLGWSPSWSPPREHKQDWLAQARRLAENLRL